MYDNQVAHDNQTADPLAKDNKVRLSRDVLEKAQMIAAEWGLKNARAAVEAVFRRYADEYLGNGNGLPSGGARTLSYGPSESGTAFSPLPPPNRWIAPPQPMGMGGGSCEAMDVLDELLGA